MTIKQSFLLVACWGVLLMNIRAADVVEAKMDSTVTLTNSYQIRNEKFGDLLRPQDANGAEGTQIVLYPAEPWKCMTWKLKPTGDSVYQVKNHFTSKTFVVKAGAAGKNVVETALAREVSARPTWRFTRLADDVYEISDPKSGDALTAVDAGISVRVIVSPWQEKPEQKWRLEKIDPAMLTM